MTSTEKMSYYFSAARAPRFTNFYILCISFLFFLYSNDLAFAQFNVGKTLTSVTVGTIVIPAGKYVKIVKDGGDSWIPQVGYNEAEIRIPKSAIKIEEQIRYNPPYLAVVSQTAPIINDVSSYNDMVTEFRQSSRSIQKDERIKIIFKERDVYFAYRAAEDNIRDSAKNFFKISTNFVEIAPGQNISSSIFIVHAAPSIIRTNYIFSYETYAISLLLIFSIVAGIFDARIRADGRPHLEWLNRSIFVYGLPMLLIWLRGPYLFGIRYIQDEYLTISVITASTLAIMAGIFFIRTRLLNRRQNHPPNLKKWFFKEETGEFHKISKSYDGYVQFSKESYSDRLMEYDNLKDSVRKQWRYLLIYLAALSFINSKTAAATIRDVVPSLTMSQIGNAGLAASALCAILLILTAYRLTRAAIAVGTYDVGPKPIRPESHTFGPDTPTTPAEHPAHDDLLYRPNA